MAGINDQTITTWLKRFETQHKGPEGKRALARAILDPDANLPAYELVQTVRFPLSLLWALDEKPLREVGTNLWRTLPAAIDHAGELAVIFRHGSSNDLTELPDDNYISMTVGRLPTEPAEYHYRFSGSLSKDAPASVEQVPAPYINGLVQLPLHDARLVSADSSGIVLGSTFPGETIVPVFEATVHLGEDQRLAEQSAYIRNNISIIGTAAVEGFMTKLAQLAATDATEVLSQLSAVA